MLFENTESIIKVERKTQILNTKSKTYEDRKERVGLAYYAATFIENADKMAKIIRGHWGIENKNNYVRDVTLNEDTSRIRKNPGIFAILRSFALNILRFNNVENIQEAIEINGYDFDRVLDYQEIF